MQPTVPEQSAGGYLLIREWLAMNLSIDMQRRRPWNRKDHRNQTIGIFVSQLRLNAVFAARRKPNGKNHGPQRKQADQRNACSTYQLRRPWNTGPTYGKRRHRFLSNFALGDWSCRLLA